MKSLRMAGIVILVVVFLLNSCSLLKMVNEYEMSGTVISTNNGIVGVELQNGTIFEYMGDGVEIGDKIQLVINVNGTDDYTKDDKVVSAELVK